jgi:hypothetical protein
MFLCSIRNDKILFSRSRRQKTWSYVKNTKRIEDMTYIESERVKEERERVKKREKE